MQIKTLVIAGLALGTLGFGAAAVADDSMGSTNMGSGSTGTMQKDDAMKSHTSGSTMNDADLRKVAIVVKDIDKRNHRVTFQATISPEANIMENGSTMKLDQLKPGDEVRAAFDPKTGTVMSLEVVRKVTPEKTNEKMK